MRQLTCFDKSKRRGTEGANDRGAIIVLLALLASVLIAFLALAVDVSIFTSQRAKYDRTAEHAALAALETYLTEINVPSTPATSLASAVTRAQTVVQLNLSKYFGSSFRKDKTVAMNDLSSNGVNAATYSGISGSVTPGRWHFVWTNACTCSTQANFRPCFEEFTSVNTTANAVRVRLTVPSTSPLRVVFKGLIPAYENTFTTTAIASLVPRRGVFLVDLSPSIVFDTHKRGTGVSGKDSEFAYYVTNNASCSGTSWRPYIDSAQKTLYDALQNNRPGGSTDTTTHYKSEFTCYPITYTNTSGQTYTESYGADTFSPASSPQPLTDVLSAIHTALLTFRDRGVTADLVGVIGFDDEVLPARTLGMVRPACTNAACSMPASPNDFDKAMFLTDTSQTYQARKDYLFFPRRYGSGIYILNGVTGRLPAMTAINTALNSAINMISTNRDEIADKFVVLITDGLSNCPASKPPGQTADCYYSTSDSNSIAISEDYVEQGVNELAAIASTYKTQKIALHVMLIGAEVQPHTLLRKDANGCMTDNSARTFSAGALSFTDFSGGDLDPTNSTPFYFPNKIYESARTSGGLWVPILDCCKPTSGSSCSTTAAATLDTVCKNTTGANGTLIPTSRCAATTGCNTAWYDANSRLLCNPKGQSKNAQVSEAIQKIMGSNPFILVQ